MFGECAIFPGFVIPGETAAVLGGVLASRGVWGVGYCLLGYAAGNAYAAIERRVGTGVAIAIVAVVLGAVVFWLVQRHRQGRVRIHPDA